MKRLLLALILCVVTSTALAQGTIAFTSTPVSGALADALAAGPDGSLWSVNQTANTISHVTFPDLHVATFNVPTAGAGLAGITAGPDGNMWFTESTAKKIGRIDASGTISEFAIPTSAAPPQRIFSGPNGGLWSFNACFFYGCSRFIVTTTAGASTELPLQVPGTASFAPSNCTLGSDGNVWCIGNETIPSPFSSQFKVARISPTGGYTAFAPATGVQGSAILAAPDGNVWYTWLLGGSSTGVARVTPSGVITEYPVPTGKSQSWIFGLALGTDGNLYFADRQTSILYELVLSSATDSGTATINSGTITIDIPEDIVSLSNSGTRASRIRTRGVAPLNCPAGISLICRSGGSLFGGIVWITTKPPTECTNLRADVQVLRYHLIDASGVASCHDYFDSHDDAKTAVLSIRLPTGSEVSTQISLGPFFADGTCTGTGPNIHCDAPLIKKGFDFEVKFEGNIEGGKTRVHCSSATAEEDDSDNDDASGGIGIAPIGLGEPVDQRTRR